MVLFDPLDVGQGYLPQYDGTQSVSDEYDRHIEGEGKRSQNPVYGKGRIYHFQI